MSSYAQKKPDFLKDYATVASRLEGFHEKYPNGRILTELMHREDGLISFKAYVYTDLDAAEPSATGHSIDTLDLQKSSFEKLETAAVGRALAFLGFGAKNISSAEEMERHESRQQRPQSVAPIQQTGGEVVTASQVGAIKTLAIKTGRNPNAYDYDNMSRAEASRLIKELQEISDASRG